MGPNIRLLFSVIFLFLCLLLTHLILLARFISESENDHDSLVFVGSLLCIGGSVSGKLLKVLCVWNM